MNRWCHAWIFILLLVFPGGLRAEGVRVLTSFAAVHSLTLNVAGEAAVVEALLPANVGPHDYAISPGDAKKLAAADIVVLNGLGMESFLDRALVAHGKERVIHAAAGITTIAGAHACRHHDHEGCGGGNPHVYLDPSMAAQMVGTIATGLAQADPAHASVYKANGERYAARLMALDAEFRATLAPLTEKRMISFHDAFPYLARRYGIEQVAVFQEFPGKEPSPKALARIVTTIRERGVKVLFCEPQYSPKLLKRIAADTGARIAVLDSLETGAHTPQFYEEAMRRNLEVLADAFR